MQPLDALQLGAFEGVEFFRSNTVAALAVVAPLTLVTLVNAHASINAPSSGLAHSLTTLGTIVDQSHPDLARFGMNFARFISDLSSVQNPSDVPIVRALQETGALFTQSLTLSSPFLVGLREYFSERHAQDMANGKAHVSRLFPLRTVLMGDSKIVDSVQRARIQAGLPFEPAVYINTRSNVDGNGPNLPYGCSY